MIVGWSLDDHNMIIRWLLSDFWRLLDDIKMIVIWSQDDCKMCIRWLKDELKMIVRWWLLDCQKWKGSVSLLVLSSSDQLLFILKLYFYVLQNNLS